MGKGKETNVGERDAYLFFPSYVSMKEKDVPYIERSSKDISVSILNTRMKLLFRVTGDRQELILQLMKQDVVRHRDDSVCPPRPSSVFTGQPLASL